MTRPYLSLCLALVFGLAAGASTAATTSCKRIGDDPYNVEQELIIDGDVGAFVYNAANGGKAVLEIQCSKFRADFRDDDTTGHLCQRHFEHDEGVAVTHYLIHKASTFAEITITEFVENSGLAQYGEHKSSAQSFPVRCRTEE